MKIGESAKIKKLMRLFWRFRYTFICSRLNLIGQVYRIGGKRKVSHMFNNNPKGRRVTKRQKKNGGCVLTDIKR